MAKVTKEDVLDNMQDIIGKTEVEFGKPVTYVSVRMKNGFTVRESSTCVDPSNYDERIGIQICLGKIEDKIWNLLGYALQDKVYQYNKTKVTQKKESQKNNSGDLIELLEAVLGGFGYGVIGAFPSHAPVRKPKKHRK